MWTSQKEGIHVTMVLKNHTYSLSERPTGRLHDPCSLLKSAPTPRPSWAAAGSTGPLSVAQAAVLALAPSKHGAVGGDGEVVGVSSRHSDDALISKGLDLLGLPPLLRVAVAQQATVPNRPSSRHRRRR